MRDPDPAAAPPLVRGVYRSPDRRLHLVVTGPADPWLNPGRQLYAAQLVDTIAGRGRRITVSAQAVAALGYELIASRASR